MHEQNINQSDVNNPESLRFLTLGRSSGLPSYLSDKMCAVNYGVHRSTIRRWVQEGRFPRPVKLNGSSRWRLADLLAWEAEQGGAA